MRTSLRPRGLRRRDAETRDELGNGMISIGVLLLALVRSNAHARDHAGQASDLLPRSFVRQRSEPALLVVGAHRRLPGEHTRRWLATLAAATTAMLVALLGCDVGPSGSGHAQTLTPERPPPIRLQRPADQEIEQRCTASAGT